MFLPVGKSDVAFGAMCAFGTLRIKNVIASEAWQSPGREPCKTNAAFLSKRNKNEIIFSGKKDFVREKY